MNRKFLLIAPLILLSLFGMGQVANLDSLEGRLKENLDKEERIKTLDKLILLLTGIDNGDALIYGEEALKLAIETGDSSLVGDACIANGNIYKLIGGFQDAMRYGFRGLDAFAMISDTSGMAKAHNLLGAVYYDLENYDQALIQYNATRMLYQAQNNKRGMVIARNNIGTVYSSQDKIGKALSNYQENIPFIIEMGNDAWLAVTYNNIGNIYKDQGDTDTALVYLYRALELKKKDGNKASIANTCNNIGETLINAGNYEEAEMHLLMANELAKEGGALERLKTNYKHLSELYELTNRPWKALESHKMMADIRDSIFTQEQSRLISEMATQYQTGKKQAQIELLNADKADKEENIRQQRASLWILGFFLILLIASSGWLITLYRKTGKNRKIILLRNEELRQNNEKLEDLNREKDGLIGIVAHDLRSPLNRSSGLAQLIELSGPLNEEQLGYLEMIKKVNEDGGSLVQDLLDVNYFEQEDQKLVFEKVSLTSIINESLLGFEPVASAKKITISFAQADVRFEINSNKEMINRILDNLISNAIKFSYPDKKVILSIFPGFSKNPGQSGVTLSVKDEGQGISEEDQKKMFKKFSRLNSKPTGGESSTGLGLSIVKVLVERLGGSIEVKSKLGEGTEFLVFLPDSSSNKK